MSTPGVQQKMWDMLSPQGGEGQCRSFPRKRESSSLRTDLDPRFRGGDMPTRQTRGRRYEFPAGFVCSRNSSAATAFTICGNLAVSSALRFSEKVSGSLIAMPYTTTALGTSRPTIRAKVRISWKPAVWKLKKEQLEGSWIST